MQCRFCLTQNSEDVERCIRCNKRLSGDITVDGLAMAGATALAPRPRTRRSTVDTTFDGNTAPHRKVRSAAATFGENESPTQPLLFSTESPGKVIPFDTIPRGASVSVPRQEPVKSSGHAPGGTQPGASKPAIRKHVAGSRTVNDAQGSLDLEMLAPAPQGPRILKTTVEASIYCDAPVAAPMHRSVAAFLDSAMILIGCSLFLAIVQFFGDGIKLDRFNLVVMGGTLFLIPMFYGLLFAIAGRETAGQNWTDLRLINFDGFPPDGASRTLRFVGCWLSFGACGAGLLWALVDEENLSWHDHMSKTFVTLRESDTSFFRERVR